MEKKIIVDEMIYLNEIDSWVWLSEWNEYKEINNGR